MKRLHAAWVLGFFMMAAAPFSAQAARSIKPGEWQWSLTDTSPMGSRQFVSTQCVSATSKPDFSAPGAAQATDCYRHEQAFSNPGGGTRYRFTCSQQAGPIHTFSSGSMVMRVARDHASARLSGRVVTQISGATTMTIVSHVSGTGTRLGPCH